MEDDILGEIDRQLSNVNSDKTWARKIGDHEVVFVPLDYVQLGKTKVALSSGEENAIEETKRVTLAGAIVGFDGKDLRPVKERGKTLKAKGKDGKTELVDLSGYLYQKIGGWDGEFIDVAYDVYSDLMESHRKEMTKDVKFENARTPQDELAELEEQAAALRQRLDLPPMIEAKLLDSESGEVLPPTLPDEEIASRADEPAEDPVPPGPPASFVGDEEDFDPFHAIRSQVIPAIPKPVPRAAPSLDVPVPQPVLGPPLPRQDPPPAYAALPNVADDVLEAPADRRTVEIPRIDRKVAHQSRNPRFHPTKA